MHWRRFCAEIIDVIEGLQIQTVISLGALLSEARPVELRGGEVVIA